MWRCEGCISRKEAWRAWRARRNEAKAVTKEWNRLSELDTIKRMKAAIKRMEEKDNG